MRAIDTNILVRALVRDNAEQAERAQALLSTYEVFIPVTVILELEWVLRSRYGFAPKVVAQAIEQLASLANVVVGERDAVLAATARATQGWDFADALHLALSAGCDNFATLDADLVKRAKRARASSVAKANPEIVQL